MIPLRIVVRTDTPWATMTMADFLAQKEPEKPTEFFRIGKVVLPIWERATGRNYFQYREHVKRLCYAELIKTGLPITVGIENLDWNGPDEALIPIDDDDILFPSVSSIAERFTSDINLLMWQRVTNYLGTERLENPHFGGQLDTCNFAVRKSFVRDNFFYGEQIQILSRHWQAATVMAPKLGGRAKPTDLMGMALEMLRPRTNGETLCDPSVVSIPERHSVYFLHSASISFLRYKYREHTNDENAEEWLRSLPLHPLFREVA